MGSLTFESARRNPSATMAGGMKIIFPAFDSLPMMELNLGTTDFEVDGDEYVAAIPDMPRIVMQRGVGQDTIDFSINDSDNHWYDIIKPYEDIIEDTEIIYKECFKDEEGAFESEIAFTGFLEQISLSDNDFQIKVNGISDMSKTGVLSGGRIISQRYCGAKFNVNGVLSPVVSACGWQLAQGGNPIFCTHQFSGVDGCEDHNNPWRYFAVEALHSAPITYYDDGSLGGGGGGFDYGGSYEGGGCFTKRNLIWMLDDNEVWINQVMRGNHVKSFDEDGHIVTGFVKHRYKKIVDKYLILDFGNGLKIEATETEPFYTNKGEFTPASELEPGSQVLRYVDSKWIKKTLRHTPAVVTERKDVYNLSVEYYETFFVNKFGFHNKSAIDYNYVN